MQQTFVFWRRDDAKWVIESRTEGIIEHSEHGSRTKALNAFFFAAHSNNSQFIITIPKGVFVFSRDNRQWAVDCRTDNRIQQRNFASYVKALRSFFLRYPVKEFYITIEVQTDASK